MVIRDNSPITIKHRYTVCGLPSHRRRKRRGPCPCLYLRVWVQTCLCLHLHSYIAALMYIDILSLSLYIYIYIHVYIYIYIRMYLSISIHVYIYIYIYIYIHALLWEGWVAISPLLRCSKFDILAKIWRTTGDIPVISVRFRWHSGEILVTIWKSVLKHTKPANKHNDMI